MSIDIDMMMNYEVVPIKTLVVASVKTLVVALIKTLG